MVACQAPEMLVFHFSVLCTRPRPEGPSRSRCLRGRATPATGWGGHRVLPEDQGWQRGGVATIMPLDFDAVSLAGSNVRSHVSEGKATSSIALADVRPPVPEPGQKLS